MKSSLLSGAVLALVLASPAARAQTHVNTRADGATLAFNTANMARVVRLIAADPVAQARWQAQRQIAEKSLIAPPRDERGIDAALEALALAYRVTGERRFADGARGLLLARAAKADWLTDMPLSRRDPPWRSDLGMGFAAASYGIAYDAIRDSLSPEDRKTIVAGLVRGAIVPILNDWVDGSRRIHTLDTMGHNWWAHIVFGAGVGVLAILRDEPRAADWARRIDAASVEWFEFAGSRFEAKPETFGADGAYSETIGYAELALHSLMLFRRSWQETFGQAPASIPALAHTADYFLAASYPRKEGWVSLNFGDSRPPSCGCHTLADFWAMGDRNPAYLRYIDGFAGGAGKDAWADATNLPYLPDAASRSHASLAALPTSSIFKSEGLVTLRDGWADGATMVALKSGFTWNHNHADAGSFILYHHGKALLADSGHSGYSTPEYDGYYRQSVAHNIVTIDGKAEPPGDLYDGSRFMGGVDHLIDTPGFRYVWADATGPTSRNFQRNFRNLLWIGDTMLVIDDLKSWDVGQFEWLLHYQGTAKRTGQVLTIADGADAVAVKPLFPQPFPEAGLPTDYPEAMRLVEHEGLADEDPRKKQTYLGFQPSGMSDREKFVVAIQPIEAGKALSRIERMEGLNWIGLRIIAADRVTEVYMNLLADGRIRHRNANATLGGYETDAYLLALSWPTGRGSASAPDQFFVANGSYLRKGGEVLLDSLSKVFAHVDRQSGAIALSRQAEATVRIGCGRNLRLGTATIPCDGSVAMVGPRR